MRFMANLQEFDAPLPPANRRVVMRHRLEVVERQLDASPATGRFCHGDTPGLADCVLVPQIFNAKRMDCRLDHVPTVMRVFEACMADAAFASTQPSACPDAT